MLPARTGAEESAKVLITRLAINWIPQYSAAATSEHSRSPSMATTWLGLYYWVALRWTRKLIVTTGSWDQDLAHCRETAGIPACITTAQQASTTLGNIGTLAASPPLTVIT